MIAAPATAAVRTRRVAWRLAIAALAVGGCTTTTTLAVDDAVQLEDGRTRFTAYIEREQGPVFHADVYRRRVEMIRAGRSGSGGEIAGMSPWILKDFRAPLRVLPGIQDGYNRKGLVSEEGERKLAFDVLQSFYGEFRLD